MKSVQERAIPTWKSLLIILDHLHEEQSLKIVRQPF